MTTHQHPHFIGGRTSVIIIAALLAVYPPTVSHINSFVHHFHQYDSMTQNLFFLRKEIQHPFYSFVQLDNLPWQNKNFAWHSLIYTQTLDQNV